VLASYTVVCVGRDTRENPILGAYIAIILYTTIYINHSQCVELTVTLETGLRQKHNLIGTQITVEYNEIEKHLQKLQ